MKKILYFMLAGLGGLSACAKEVLQNTEPGHIVELSASITEGATKVSMTDGSGVSSFRWKTGDKLAFYRVVGTGATAVYIDPLYFQLDPISDGTTDANFTAMSDGLTAGYKYFAAHVGGLTKLSYQANLMKLVFTVPSSIQQSSADPAVSDRFKHIEDSECFYAQTFTATDPVTPLVFTHKMSVLRFVVKSTENVSIKSVRIQAPGAYFVTEAILSNTNVFTYNTTDHLSVSLTDAYSLPGDNLTTADLRVLCWWNPEVLSASGNYTITVTTADGKIATTTYPATKVWAPGKVYTLPVNATDFVASTIKPFSELSSESEGKITHPWKIRGVVISPNKNENLNYYREDGTYWYSDANDRTVYIQDETGKGIRLLTLTTEDNVFAQGQTVDLMLDGLTLSKDAVCPTAVSLSGITRGHIVSVSSLIPMPEPKERTIGQLTDADVYSYVKIKAVEFAIKDGGLTNMNEGYTFRVGTIPSLLEDAQGESLTLLTNTNVPYRRLLIQTKGANTMEEWFVRRFNVAANNGALPAGSGDVTGILVSDRYARFKNITKYSLRHLSAADIAISTDAQTRFSKDVCGFVDLVSFPKATNTQKWWSMPMGGALSHSKVLTATSPKAFSGTSSTGVFYVSKQHSSVGAVNINDGNLKGQKDSSCVASYGLCNWSSAVPEYLLVKFPSKDINTTGLTLSLSGYVGYSGSNYWKVEYASDWTSTATWTSIGEFSLPSMVSWSNGTKFPVFQSPAFDMISYKLPAEIAQMDTTYIRIIPKNKTGYTDADVAASNGTSGNTYWGAIVIKTNK